MAFEIIMPKLGVDMQEGEIIEWKKQEGDVSLRTALRIVFA